MNANATPQSSSTTYEPVIAPQIEKVVKSLGHVGKLWASHGLQVGQQTLETSAKTLGVAAETLASIKARISDKS